MIRSVQDGLERPRVSFVHNGQAFAASLGTGLRRLTCSPHVQDASEFRANDKGWSQRTKNAKGQSRRRPQQIPGPIVKVETMATMTDTPSMHMQPHAFSTLRRHETLFSSLEGCPKVTEQFHINGRSMIDPKAQFKIMSERGSARLRQPPDGATHRVSWPCSAEQRVHVV